LLCISGWPTIPFSWLRLPSARITCVYHHASSGLIFKCEVEPEKFRPGLIFPNYQGQTLLNSLVSAHDLLGFPPYENRSYFWLGVNSRISSSAFRWFPPTETLNTTQLKSGGDPMLASMHLSLQVF
jgi:hypothetical protein